MLKKISLLLSIPKKIKGMKINRYSEALSNHLLIANNSTVWFRIINIFKEFKLFYVSFVALWESLFTL